MGLSSFVGTILGGRSVRHEVGSTSVPIEEAFSTRTPRRLRGIIRERDRTKDRDRERGVDRPHSANHLRHSLLHLRSGPTTVTPWESARLDTNTDQNTLHEDLYFEESNDCLAEFTVPARAKRGWHKVRHSSRVKSNLEDVFSTRNSPSPRCRTLQQKSISPTAQDPTARPHSTQCHFQYRSQYRNPTRDPDLDGSSNLKRLVMKAGVTATGIPENESQCAKRWYSVDHHARDYTSSRPYNPRAGRIRSNLDQFMRRDKEASFSKRVARPAAGRRRHSLIADLPMESHDVDEPISLINEFIDPTDASHKADDFFPRPSSPSFAFKNAKPPKVSMLRSEGLVRDLVKPVTATMANNQRTSLSSSNSSESTGSPSTSTLSMRSKRGPPRETRRLTMQTPAEKVGTRSKCEVQYDAYHLLHNQNASADAVKPRMRLSAEDLRSARQNDTSVTARSYSNTTAPMLDSAKVPKLTHKKRPPPLRTPTENATGFACGVGLNSGIRRVPLGRTSCDSVEEVVQGDLRNVSTVTLDAAEDQSLAKPSLVGIKVAIPLRCRVETHKNPASDGKESSRFDIWSPEPSQNGSSGSSSSRFSRRPADREEDLFRFEEASQSSFGDSESPSRRREAKNGVVSSIEGPKITEVLEDHFVFGADGSFCDGGFIISSNGLVEAPERLMRKTSDGAAVEGVPTSSNNIIFVKSLDEFRKSYTFRSSSKDGSSTLGRGSAGRVYLASHRPSGRKIAVKEINVYDEEKRKQLRKELQTLFNHQSRFLVRSFGAFYDGAGVVHVTLEFMDRGSLADVVLQRGRIPEPVVCKLMEHCLRGLAFLHENHILHRDVKTANILLSRKLCRAKLSDFGLARDLEADNKSRTDSFVGTLAYMSPERLHGRIYTYASDIWSIGITVMECVMGKFPFDKPQSYFDIVDAVQSDPAFLVQNEEISESCLDFIRLCLQPEMEERPTARDLLQHNWIRSRLDDAHVLREWLDTIPRLHCEDVEIGSELAFHAREKQRARLKAKAQCFL